MYLMYFPHHKYQVKPRSSPWFSVVCAATIAHIEIIFFNCANRVDLLNLKYIKFKQASNCSNRVLKAAKFACATKTKESITS